MPLSLAVFSTLLGYVPSSHHAYVAKPRTPAAQEAACGQTPTLCAELEAGIAHWKELERRRRVVQGKRLPQNLSTLLSEEEASARSEAAHAVAKRRMLSSTGCTPLVRAALATLSGVHRVLFLEDNHTMPTLHAVAHGALSFRPPAAGSPYWASPTLRSAVNAKAQLQPYKAPDVVQLAREQNNCSTTLYARVRARQAHGQGSPHASRSRLAAAPAARGGGAPPNQ
jgi:hypothetical protein